MRELFAIERDGEPFPGMAYRHREVTERYLAGSNERVVRYVPEDLDARAALASVKARLERFGEKLSLQRMPAELMRELTDIAKAAEVAIGD